MTPAELQLHVADALGVPFPTVSVYARFLRQGNFLTRAGRGRSAPRMTTRDAALIMVSVCGSDGPGEACATVERFSAVRVENHNGNGFLGMLTDLDGMVGAIEGLLDSLVNGDFEKRAHEIGLTYEQALGALQVMFYTNGPARAAIRLSGHVANGENRQYRAPEDGRGPAPPLGRISYLDGQPFAYLAGLFARSAPASEVFVEASADE